MMRKPKGYDEAKVYSDGFRKLPAGGYVVEIKKAVMWYYENGNEYLQISFDIAEGDYKGFYVKQYEESTFEPKKYKGNIRINWPKEDGSEQDNWTLRNLKTQMTAIEDSNEGFTFDWTNEDKLVGLKAGLLFRNKEYNYNGSRGFWTEPFRFIEADKVRRGDYQMPKDKLLKDGGSAAGSPDVDQMGFRPLADDEVPF